MKFLSLSDLGDAYHANKKCTGKIRLSTDPTICTMTLADYDTYRKILDTIVDKALALQFKLLK